MNFTDDFEITRTRFERLLAIPEEERNDDDLFELMRLTSTFKVFESILMTNIHKELCRHMFSRTLERGEIIFKQGDEGDAYYFILRGCVDIYMYDIDQNDGKTKIKFLTSTLAGHGFGELALLYDCPRTATAIPNTKTDLVVIKKRYYNRLCKDLHEKELLSLVKFYYTIIIFKKEPISNILKYCLRTNKKSLNSYEPFILFNEVVNYYSIIQSGSIKCFVRIKINNYAINTVSRMSETEFVNYMKALQKEKFNFKGEARPKSDDMKSVYEEVLDIMEFGEKDMYAEYYVARGRKINVYLLPVLPTDIITIHLDDLKKVNPQLQETIVKYAKPIFDEDIVYSKLYQNLCWNKTKSGLLNSALNKK